MADSTPTVFGGRYEMHRRIARGGMAEVYLARDQLLDRWVAVKVLFAQFAADPTFVERFRREAQAAAKLSHPNIVAVYDWGEENGTYFIVMEYIEGMTLGQVLAEEGKLSPKRASEITIEVAKGLGYAHSKGYVHLDTKSGNVLISKKGEVKVADFGISKAIAGTVEANLTATGAVMGTASYFSPEQAQGQRVGPPSDLYSLGVVLFEMLSGRTPFQGDTSVAVAYKHVQEPPPSFSELNIQVPPALEAIDRKLLEKRPEDRYENADALIADLQRFLAGQPVAAMPRQSAQGRTAAHAPSASPTATAVQTSAAPPVYGAPGASAPQPVAADATTAIPVPVYDNRPQPEPDYYGPPAHEDHGSPVGLIFGGLFVLLGVIGVVGILLYLVSNGGSGGDGGGQKQKFEMANYVGSPFDQVEPILKEAGLEVEAEREESSEVASGLVMEQDPEAGEVLETGDTVKFVVSSGEAPIKVPNVVGNEAGDAQAQLEQAGFQVTVTQEYSDQFENSVISQSPVGGTEIGRGEVVNIVVSQGPEESAVPQVTNFDYDQAVQVLSDAGFSVERQDAYSDSVPSGQVIETNPPSGTSLPPNSFVTIVVSAGPELTTIPDVVGQDFADAQATLLGAGYNVNYTEVETDQRARDGVVVAQDPPANSQSAPGSAVVLQVGVFQRGNNGGDGGNGDGNDGNGVVTPPDFPGNGGTDSGNTGGNGGTGGGTGGGTDGQGQTDLCTNSDGEVVEC